MKRILGFVEKYFFLVIIAAVVVSLTYPNSFKWVLGKFNGFNTIDLLLGVVLFGMGTTLKLENFIKVFKSPKEILVGISAQYIIMPVLAFAIASIFSLDVGLTVGLILVGCVPGGTASDVITFLANGDLALSVSLTAISTVISPILTPLIVLLLVGNQILFNPIDMFLSILQIVIVPISLGLILNYKFPELCDKLNKYLPVFSSIVVCLIVAGVIGANKQAIVTSFGIVILIVILQYFVGMMLGFVVGYLAGMNRKQMITLAIEIAFQNSGLSTSLAKTHFPSLAQATVPGAIYSAWQNFAGSILAYFFKKHISD